MTKIYSIQEIFGQRNLRDALYVVKSPDAVVYVGMARVQCVCDRMTRHVGDVFAKESPSRFSLLLFRNHPAYFNWQIEIFSRLEAEAVTGQIYDCLPCAERGLYDHFKQLQGAAPSGNAKRPYRCKGATPNPPIERTATSQMVTAAHANISTKH